MSAFPLMLEGTRLRALVVGGGGVAERKVRALLDAGATVRLVAPDVTTGIAALASSGGRLRFERRAWAPDDVGDAMLVIAATDRRDVNAAVAAAATALGRLVNVADAPDEGNCATAATHRAGDLTIAVSAGGVPTAAARVRDAIAARFDARYAAALASLVALRRRTLDERGTAAWKEAQATLIGDDFCAGVESGALAERVGRWA